MLRLALLGLRGRRSAFAGAAAALLTAAVVVTACGVLLASGIRSSPTVDRYAGAPVVVAGKQTVHIRVSGDSSEDVPVPERARVPAALTGRLAAIPGVRTAVADRSIRTEVLGPRGPVRGPGGHDTYAHPWSSAALTPFALAQGRPPASAVEVVVDAGLAHRGGLRVGSRVRLASTGPQRPLRVVGIVAAHAPSAVQASVFVTDDQSRRLSGGSDRVDAVGLLAAPGADATAIAAAARHIAGPGAVALTGADRGKAELLAFADSREALLAIMGTFGGLALVIAAFVIAGALGLAIQLRDRELALLRAIAVTPRQLRRMLRWEAVLLALAASAVGYLPGLALARVLGEAFSARGLAPDGMVVSGGLLPMAATVAATVLCALASAWAGARRAARVPPTRALQEAAVAPPLVGVARGLLGLVAVAGGVALLLTANTVDDPDTAFAVTASASLVCVTAVAFLGPLVASAASFVPGALVARISPVAGFLATAATRTAPRRAAAAMTPLVLTVGVSCTLLFSGTTQDRASAEQSRERQRAQLVLTSSGGGVPESALSAARRTPGVAAAVGVRATSVVPLEDSALGSQYASMPAQTADADGLARVLDLGVRSGSLDALHGDAVALGDRRARDAGVRVGDRVAVALGDGTRTRLRVAATYERSLGFGEMLLPRQLAAAHTTDRLPETVLVRTAAGAPAHRVERSLRAIAAAHPGVRVEGRTALRSADARDRDMRLWTNRVLVGLIFVFTSIAAVNTLSMIALARGRELALLRLVGATPRQLARMARWESGLVVLVGLGLGLAIALACLAPYSQALTGSPMPHVELPLLASVIGVTAALGLLASQLPTRLALRTRPADAVGVKE